MEYSRVAHGSIDSLGAATSVILPFVPDYIEIDNLTAAATPAQNGVPKAIWYSGMGQGAALTYVFNATNVLTTAAISTATGTGFRTFSAGTPALDAAIGISSITKASPAVVTTTANHGYASGDVVIFTGLFQSASTGMPQICSMPFTVTVTGATTFTIPWNTNQSNYTALSGSPSGAFVRKISHPYLYFPGINFISAITRGATTTIDTTTNHNLVTGQLVAFRIPSTWGTIELNTPNSLSNPVYGYVTSVTDANTVVVAINSSAMTAFDSNQTVASALAGLSLPQMVSVGDNNTGVITNSFLPTTINASTIGGAFQNNTRQGFVIGSGVAGTAGDDLYWKAYLNDYSNYQI